MKKEIFFAIGAGAILGLIIAFGVWRVNSTISPTDQDMVATSTPTPITGFSITVANYEDGDVVTEGSIEISGLTKPNSKVLISAEEKDYLTESDAEGLFKQEVDLEPAVNEIIFKAFDENGNSAEENLVIVYSSTFAKYLEPDEEVEEEETATEEADPIKEKVEEKVKEVLINPKAYLGTVTDIAESTLQVRDLQGEIQQIAVEEETESIKVDKTSTTIDFEDIAIGDYVVAMGFKNGNGVLEAKRILVTASFEPSGREILMGSVLEIGKSSLSLNLLPQNEEREMPISKNTDILEIEDRKASTIDIDDLEEENIIYIFGKKEDGEFETRTVYFESIPETPSPIPSPSPTEE